jgi:hypothetical protein
MFRYLQKSRWTRANGRDLELNGLMDSEEGKPPCGQPLLANRRPTADMSRKSHRQTPLDEVDEDKPYSDGSLGDQAPWHPNHPFRLLLTSPSRKTDMRSGLFFSPTHPLPFPSLSFPLFSSFYVPDGDFSPAGPLWLETRQRLLLGLCSRARKL